jgi:hypothetical protein
MSEMLTQKSRGRRTTYNTDTINYRNLEFMNLQGSPAAHRFRNHIRRQM